MAVFIHEFLYRGRPEGSDEPPAWHLTLASTGVDDFGAPAWSEKTLNIAEAEAAGWALPEIIDAINSKALVELHEVRAKLSDLAADLDRKDEMISEQRSRADVGTSAMLEGEETLTALAYR